MSSDSNSRRLLEVLKLFSELIEQNEPAIRSFLQKASEHMNALLSTVFLTTAILSRGGWISSSSIKIDLSEAAYIVRATRGKTDDEIQKELDTLIPEYFRKNNHEALKNMIEEWEEHFEDRLHIFKDALCAHMQGKYTLSIPVLATQVEGVIRNLVGDFSASKEWRETFLERCEEKLGKGQGSKKVEAKSVEELQSILRDRISEIEKLTPVNLGEKLKLFSDRENLELPSDRDTFELQVERIIEIQALISIRSLFGYKSFSDSDASTVVNRHVICHGVFTKFEEKESLQMFLVLDLLHEVIPIYKAKDTV